MRSPYVATLFAATPGTRPAAVSGLINGIAVAAPLAMGLLAGEPAHGAAACLGAYVAAFTNKGGPRRSRTLGLVTAAFANALAFLLGTFTAHLVPVAVVVLTGLVVVAALGSTVSPTAARLGTMPATAYLASSLTDGDSVHASLIVASLVLAGGLWYAAATCALTPSPRIGQILGTIAECYAVDARNLAAIGSGEPERADVAAALRRAEAAVADMATPGGDESVAALLGALVERAKRIADLCAALDATTPVPAAHLPAARRALADVVTELESTVDSLARGASIGPSRGDGLAALSAASAALRVQAGAGAIAYDDVVAVGRYRRLLEAISAASASAAGLAERVRDQRRKQIHPQPAPRPPLFDAERLRRSLTRESADFRHALRIGAITAVFAAVVGVFGIPHGEWGILAVLRILRPQYGATVERAGQRVVGNVVGGACAAILIAWVANPDVLVAILFVVITAGFTLRPVNYAFWVVFGTPLVLLIGDIANPGDWGAAVARIVMTVVGSAVAVVGGYAMWPSWERDGLAGRVDRAVITTAAYLSAALTRLTAPETDVGATRDAAESALVEARAALVRSSHEPGDAALPARAAAVLDDVTILHRSLAALSALPATMASEIPRLDEYTRSATQVLTSPRGDRADLTAAQRQSLDAMYAYLAELHSRRVDELSTDAVTETLVRTAIRENEPLIDLFAALTHDLEDFDERAG